ncbi:MAG: hypothetical protein MUF23_00595 [Pirellula sp.]|nr:hypothetical protein [Pirellula sp.]
MVRSGMYAVTALCLFILCQQAGISQEPPKLDTAPSEQSLPPIPADDPVMRAILERSLPIPLPSSESSALPPRPSGKADVRWRIAERLLRQARLMERDAESIEALGDQDTAMELRSIAQATRTQVLRLFKSLEIKSLP